MDAHLHESLAKLGITPGNYRVLMLLPLVYVAWADGTLDEAEIIRIDEVARTKLFIGASGIEILDQWMADPPSREYFDEGLQDLFLLAQSADGEPLVHPEELQQLLTHAEAIARATGHAFDCPTGITKEEENALIEIARILKVDNGMSWARLLDELDTGPKSIARGRRPSSLPPP